MSIKVLYQGGTETGLDGLSAAVDIVAVHGLNYENKDEHSEHTWEEQESKHLWLRDAFPLFGASKERFVNHANSLLEYLRLSRSQEPERPLIFVAHSLGGILVKQALVNAGQNPRYEKIQGATFGLVFFGTPHAGPTEGAKVQFGRICASIVGKFSTNPSNDIMEALTKGSLFSDVLQEGWRHQLERYRVVSFYEKIGNLVPKHSACIGLPGDRENQIGLDADHGSMCCFHPNRERDKQNYFLVEGNLAELVDEAAASGSRICEDMIEELFGSLEPHGRNPRKDRIKDPYHHSFEWLWKEHPDGPGFLEWLQDDNHFFWISGKPGSGKSTLMKQVVEDSQTIEYLKVNATEPVRILSFFFWELGGNEEQNFLGFLHGFLAQLLSAFKGLISQVMPKFQQLKRNVPLNSPNSPNSISIWSESELIKTLKAIKFEEIHGLTCLFIDGLDECAGNHRKQLEFLLPWIESANTSKLSLKVCLASRPLIEIELRLCPFPGFKMHEWTAPDITSYTKGKLREAIALTSSEDSSDIHGSAQHKLITNITDKSSGVFLWVKLVVKEMIIGIEEGFTDQELQDLLIQLPEDLVKMYENILSKVPETFKRDTHIYFQLLINALDPYLDLLYFALACEDPRDALCDTRSINEEEYCRKAGVRIKSRCRGLIQVYGAADPDDVYGPETSTGHGIVMFIHRTVIEYLKASDTNYLSDISTTSDMNFNAPVSLMAAWLRLSKMGKCCQVGICDCRPDVKPCELGIAYFFEYARQAEYSTKVAQTIYIEELDRCYKSKDWYEKGLVDERRQHWNTNLLCVATYYNLRLYVLEQLQRGIQVKRDSGRPYLFYAVAHHYHSEALMIAADLTQHGADVNEVFEGVTPWTVFLFDHDIKGMDEVTVDDWVFLCEIMLQNGADSNFNPLKMVLWIVADWLEAGLKPSKTAKTKIANIMALFLDKGADLYQIEELGKTSFQLAEEMKKQYPEMWEVVRKHAEKENLGLLSELPHSH